MQKAQLIINFWDGMDSDSCNKFLDHIHDHCSPKSEYYDDDMTEGGEEDLKKVTIQIKVSCFSHNVSSFVNQLTSLFTTRFINSHKERLLIHFAKGESAGK